MEHGGDVSFGDDLINIRPAQLTQRRCNIFAPTETSHSAHAEIDRFFARAVAVPTYSSPTQLGNQNMRKNQTFDKRTSDTLRLRKACNNVVAALSDSRDVLTPRQVLIDDSTQDFGALTRRNFIVTEINDGVCVDFLTTRSHIIFVLVGLILS